MANRTPLYDWHVARNGRMVDFAGWSMPIQYSGIVEEHQAVRTKCGLFDISHMGRLQFSGPDAETLIDHVVTCRVANLKPNQIRYGLVCNLAGGVRDDILVYRRPEGLALVVNASNREKIVEWIQSHQSGYTADVIDQTFATMMVAVQGPHSVAILEKLAGPAVAALKYYFGTPATISGTECYVSRTGYTGEDGFEVILPARAIDVYETLAAEVAAVDGRPCGLGCRDTLRLEAAMPLYGHEMNEDVDPWSAGLDFAIKLDKGEFLGRDALARLQMATRRERIGLVLAGRRIAREGMTVFAGDQPIGTVTSGTFSPTLQKSIAMALVERDWLAEGDECQIDVRGQRESARRTALPFYRRGN